MVKSWLEATMDWVTTIGVGVLAVGALVMLISMLFSLVSRLRLLGRAHSGEGQSSGGRR